MPLPPALAARLAKRGIVKDASEPVKPNENRKRNEDEEVFAEAYDDMASDIIAAPPEEHPTVPMSDQPVENEHDDDVDSNDPIIAEVINCPMVINPYHECSDYCKKTYGLKIFEPDLKMLKLRDRMLRKFPLPENWREVADPVSNHYYYWNMMTDQVSWLSPVHPRANVTLPADRLKGLLSEKENLSDQEEDEEERMEDGSDLSDDDGMSGSNSEEEDISDRNINNRKRDPDRGGPDRGRGRDKRGGRKQKEELDPMDPASYSEAPRGTWSSGLEQRGVAKTGVDSTASGPLFQQRPYPSPGAVLRANKQMEENNG